MPASEAIPIAKEFCLMDDRRLHDLIVRATAKCLDELQGIPVGVSNRHVHLSRSDMAALFGEGAKLHVKKALRQPGQFAAEETVTLRGPTDAVFRQVRILGPLRPESQVEISEADGRRLGISAPIRESGALEDTPGLVLEGPVGRVELRRGVIVAWRHIHLSVGVAGFLDVCDKERVCVETGGPRACVLKNVLVRVSDKFQPEMHVDTDEANACGLKNGDIIRICKERRDRFGFEGG
jgi:putative phosphotransacetylase